MPAALLFRSRGRSCLKRRLQGTCEARRRCTARAQRQPPTAPPPLLPQAAALGRALQARAAPAATGAARSRRPAAARRTRALCRRSSRRRPRRWAPRSPCPCRRPSHRRERGLSQAAAAAAAASPRWRFFLPGSYIRTTGTKAGRTLAGRRPPRCGACTARAPDGRTGDSMPSGASTWWRGGARTRSPTVSCGQLGPGSFRALPCSPPPQHARAVGAHAARYRQVGLVSESSQEGLAARARLTVAQGPRQLWPARVCIHAQSRSNTAKRDLRGIPPPARRDPLLGTAPAPMVAHSSAAPGSRRRRCRRGGRRRGAAARAVEARGGGRAARLAAAPRAEPALSGPAAGPRHEQADGSVPNSLGGPSQLFSSLREASRCVAAAAQPCRAAARALGGGCQRSCHYCAGVYTNSDSRGSICVLTYAGVRRVLHACGNRGQRAVCCQ